MKHWQSIGNNKRHQQHQWEKNILGGKPKYLRSGF